MYGRHPSGFERRARSAACRRHGSSPCSAWRSASRRSNVGDGWRRCRHARDHARRRPSRAARAARPDGGCRATAECGPGSRLSRPLAIARGAGHARRTSGIAGTWRPAGAVRRSTASGAARPARCRSEAARIREFVCKQRRSQSTARKRASGPGPQHAADECGTANRFSKSVG